MIKKIKIGLFPIANEIQLDYMLHFFKAVFISAIIL